MTNNKFSPNIQDSHMLRAEGEVLSLLLKRYMAAVERGDAQEIVSLITGLDAHVRLCKVWTRMIEPNTVNGTALVPMDQEVPQEHDDFYNKARGQS